MGQYVFHTILPDIEAELNIPESEQLSLAAQTMIQEGVFDKLEVGGQLKLLYWGRYSTGVGFTHEQTLYGFASRSISDVFNFTKNTSLQLAVGKNFKEQETKFLLGVGIRL